MAREVRREGGGGVNVGVNIGELFGVEVIVELKVSSRVYQVELATSNKTRHVNSALNIHPTNPPVSTPTH